MPWKNEDKKVSDLTWTLHHERIYLLNLGTGLWSRETRMGRKELLESYIATIGFRKEGWAKKALEFAKDLLEEEYGHDGEE